MASTPIASLTVWHGSGAPMRQSVAYGHAYKTASPAGAGAGALDGAGTVPLTLLACAESVVLQHWISQTGADAAPVGSWASEVTPNGRALREVCWRTRQSSFSCAHHRTLARALQHWSLG